MTAIEEAREQARKALATQVTDVLVILDALNATGAIRYDDYAQLHDMVTAMDATEPPADAVDDLANAIRLTVEYVGNDTLPAVEGWSWFDALRRHRPDMAEAFVSRQAEPPANVPDLPKSDIPAAQMSLSGVQPAEDGREALATRLTGDILDAVPDDNDMQHMLELAALALRGPRPITDEAVLAGLNAHYRVRTTQKTQEVPDDAATLDIYSSKSIQRMRAALEAAEEAQR